MRKHLMPEMREGGVNVTPLIDIVMVLIVFFMLVAKIGVTTGADPTIQPPETILGVALKDLGNTLTLNVTGSPRLEEPIVTALVEKGDREPREVKIFENRGGTVDRPLERVLTAFRQTNPSAKLIILGQKDLQYHLLEQVLISAANAKITSVNFQTVPAGGTASSPPAR
jgi:biopolymer transport protein ExbD